MVLAVGIFVLIALALPLLFVAWLRRWGMEQSDVENRLRAPGAHTVSYVVPEGQDPALVRTALAHDGFESVLDRTNVQQLLVRCDLGDRNRVREIIGRVHGTDYGGHDLTAHQVRLEGDPS